MRIHVVGMPHVQTTRAGLGSDETRRAMNLCTMMRTKGHEVFLYSGWDNEASCSEHVPLVRPDEHADWWPGVDFSGHRANALPN
jgi:hypothetical protein